MLLVDLSHTAHCASPTGVQRLARAVCLELERRGQATAVCFDRWQGSWRGLSPGERDALDAPRHDGPRYRHRPGDALRGAASRVVPALNAGLRIPHRGYAGLLVVEKFESRRAGELARLRPYLEGPSVAVVHDLIPIKFPDFATRRSRREFAGYLETLCRYDGVAAVSEASRRDLLDHWSAQGVPAPPPVTVVAPASDPVAPPPSAPAGGDGAPVLLMVGTIEARKNQLAVLEACEGLWREGMRFALRLVGRRRGGAGQVMARIEALRSAGRPVEWRGHVSDEALAEAYAACRFTLCPSLYEGYGLPVVESLRRLRPCVVSERGGLVEAAADGGCLVLPDPGADAVSAGIRRLLRDDALYRDLVDQCRCRRYRDWGDYVDDLTGWMRSLPRRAV